MTRRRPPAFEVRGEDCRLQMVSILRALPGRRLAGRARWKGENVFAKVLLDPRKAPRQCEAELRGASLLKDAGIPAPGVVTTLKLEEGRVAVLFRWLENLETAGEALGIHVLPETRRRAILELAHLLGRAEDRGLVPTDPHLGNFGRNERGWWFLDAGSVRSGRKGATSRRAEETAFSRFIAQWDPADDVILDEAVAAWSRSSKRESFSSKQWRRAQSKHRRERLARYDRKMLRPSRRFEAPAPGLLLPADLAPTIREPVLAWASSLHAPSAGRVRLADDLVVLVRAFDRRKDARKTWCVHQRLELFGVPHTLPLLLGDGYVVEGALDDDGSFDAPALRALLSRLRVLGADGLIRAREDVIWHDGRPILRPRPEARVGPPPAESLDATEDESRVRELYGTGG